MRPWRRRCLRTRLEAERAIKELAVILKQRAASRRTRTQRYRPLSERETEVVIGPDLLAQLAAAGQRQARERLFTFVRRSR